MITGFIQIKKKTTTDLSDFISEVDTQISIFEDSKEFFEPICPSIVYAKNIQNNELKKQMLKYFGSHVETTNENKTKLSLLSIYKSCVSSTSSNFDLGIIAMEMVENSQTVFSYINNPNTNTNTNEKDKKKCLKLCVYEHYRLFKLGFLHGDFHLGNALYIPDYEYMDGYKGRVMLIDFSATFNYKDNIQKNNEISYNNDTEIVNSEKTKCINLINSIKDLIKDNKDDLSNISIRTFIDIMLNICAPSWSNPYDCMFNLNWHSYNWIEKFKNEITDFPIKKMDDKRQIVIDKFTNWLSTQFPDFDINNINTFTPKNNGGRKKSVNKNLIKLIKEIKLKKNKTNID